MTKQLALRIGRIPLLLLAMAALYVLAVNLSGLNGLEKASSAALQPLPALDSPVRLAVGNSADLLLVSDLNSHQVHFLNRNTLTSTRTIDLAGRPSGIAQWKNRVVIANQEAGSVCIYSNGGIFSHCLGDLSEGTGEFLQPNDLAIDHTGEVVHVVDTKARRIKSYFLSDGSFTGRETGVGILVQPTALALEPQTGNLYVSDFGDAATLPQIQIFDRDGQFLRSILGGKARFSTPQGLYVDNQRRVFVADAVAGEIVVFDASGGLLGRLGKLGIGEGELFYPLDVVIDDRSQDVFVADTRNARITVFRRGGELP